MKSHATERPWKVESNVRYPNRLIYSEIGPVASCCERLGPSATDFRSSGEVQAESEANARLIVKAVNNHDKLVKTLSIIIDRCERVPGINLPDDIIQQAKQSLKDAESKG